MAKTLGEMSPEERAEVVGRAVSALQAELTANAPAIARILAAPMPTESDRGDVYWVITVSRANGSTMTFGPWSADRAHATKDAAEGPDVVAFVVGKR